MGIVSDSFKHGLPHQATTIDGAAVVQGKGKIWYLNASQAGVGGNGTSWATAYSSMAQIEPHLQSGDVIYLSGKLLEQWVTPAQVFDVSVIGIGNRPRHADATPVGGNLGVAQWGPPASGAVSGQATVRVLQQGWRFENILFTMESATAAGVELVRNAASGDLERDASHAVVRGCKFAGAGIGVRSGVAGVFTEIVNNALIEDNDFFANTTAVSGINGHYWKIKNNNFTICTNDINCPFTAATIKGNVMSIAPTICIDLSTGGTNRVVGNYLSGTYADGTLYNSASGDNWNGNYASTGVTAAVPA